MHLSDIAELPFKLGAQVRHGRAFHPIGVLARGNVERSAVVNEGLPLGSGDVIARLSKGAGLPDGWPDFAGLAWRTGDGAAPWDVLMVSAGSGALGRMLLRPATSWSQATFSTLMPLGYKGQTWWLRARFMTTVQDTGLSLDSVSNLLQTGSLRIAIDQANRLSDFTPLATITLTDLLAEPDGGRWAFDPTAHSDPGVALLPGWLTKLRRGAYREAAKDDMRRGAPAADQCDERLVDMVFPNGQPGPRAEEESEQDLLNEIEDRLVDTYAELRPDQISATVGQAHSMFVDSPIRDFIPLLVERRARRTLASLV